MRLVFESEANEGDKVILYESIIELIKSAHAIGFTCVENYIKKVDTVEVETDNKLNEEISHPFRYHILGKPDCYHGNNFIIAEELSKVLRQIAYGIDEKLK